MKSTQHTKAKQQNTKPTHNENMKGSRSQGSSSRTEKDFDYLLAKKYGLKSENERNLYFNKLLDAFKTLSVEAPEVFDSIAPEMLQRSIWEWRGADPLLSKKFNNWLIEEYKWTPFDDILPQESARPVLRDVPPLDPKHLEAAQAQLIEEFQARFYGDPHRWDASRRDQFIILGMLATAGGFGVRQGKLIHSLGMGLEPGGVRGSNTVRAAKIALTRMAKPLGINLFAPAAGHGSERVHYFADEHLADIIARYVLNHEASVLLPVNTVAAYGN
ncbi:MAG: hypothetical protein ISP84_05120 [Candidatus Poseidonia sp.]|jgi:hypothetical protein|nr:hypothetical protein [Poseidonia sp.]